MVLVLGAFTFRLPFGHVLIALVAAHLGFWLASVSLMLAQREKLQLTSAQLAGLGFEALLVPGYLVNQAKRVWLKRSLDVAAVTVGLRALRTVAQDAGRDLYAHRMERRLDELTFEWGLAGKEGEAEAGTTIYPADSTELWFIEARRCLTASALQASP